MSVDTSFSYKRWHADENMKVVIEKDNCGSIGILVPCDGAELQYFNELEVRMFAFALLSMVGEIE